MKPNYFFIALILIAGCKDKSNPVAPGIVTVETTISTDGSGLVTFKAASQHAVNFAYYFGEGLDDRYMTSSGSIVHTYTSSGTYTVRIAALSADNLEADKTMDIVVSVTEPPIATAGYSTPLTYAGMQLVWQDEFSGDALNTAVWNFETGPFNDELEYYQPDNTSVQQGYLIIKAKLEKKANQIYTSSRLTTQNKKAFTYGRVDIRAMVPKTQGLFPALWMLGSSFSTIGWPKCGEIDIMETIGGGGRDSVCYGTAHWDNAGTHASYGGHRGLTTGHVLGDEFHVYSIVWNSKKIVWYLDDVQYHVIDITPAELDELTKEFFFIFNVAVGGGWAGNPDATTVFPQRLVVDYIRVFQ